ncbi:MAG: hypothetical protein AAFP77_16920 [Bacteroidota bacterium]
MRKNLRLSLRLCFQVAFILLSLNAYAQASGEIISVKGTIGNHFHLSSTHKIEESNRMAFLKEVEPILDKMELLDQYYTYESRGMTIEANELLQSDSLLAEANAFGLAYAYTVVKMKEMEILFLPLIQCNGLTEGHLISLTEAELDSFEAYLNKNIEVVLLLEKIGFIESDGTTLFKFRGTK